MKRLYILLFAIIPLFALTSCKMEEGEERSSLKLAKLIYERSNRDMEFAANCIMSAVHFNRLLSLDTEELRSEYQEVFFPHSQLLEQDGVYTLLYQTNYGGYSELKISTGGVALGKGVWKLEYNSGDSFTLLIKPGSGTYSQAELSFDNRDSEGVANLQFQFTYVPWTYNEAMKVGKIGITGELTAVDRQASKVEPVTIRTNISAPLVFDYNMSYFSLGSTDITCHDAIYDVTDRVQAEYFAVPHRVVLKCNGDSWTLTN